MEKRSGIYRIDIGGNFYYGSSVNLDARIKNHISKLRAGKHRNARLQRCFNKYGESDLLFTIVEMCRKEDTLLLEQKYLSEGVGKSNCLNFCKDAFAPMKGISFSIEHKKKISLSQAKNKYTFYFNEGKTANFSSLREIAEYFNVIPALVSKWFKRKNLGRKNGVLFMSGVIKVSIEGSVTKELLPFPYKEEPWVLAKATSKSQYYRGKRNASISS